VAAPGLPPVVRTLADACEPAQLALVVYDCQVGIVRQLREPERLVATVRRVLDAARAAGVRVVFMRHLSMPLELSGSFALRQAMAWQRVERPEEVRPWFLRGSEAHALVPELEPRESEAILDKVTMSAFEGTPLALVLRDCGVRSFAIVGAATEIGIEPTVRHGTDLGLVPIVVEDAIAAGDDEAARRALATMRFLGDAFVASADEVCALLGRP
jgi:nicotinamidase-related amidase